MSCVLLWLLIVDYAFALTGHVCTRERAENFQTMYNHAFICQERYTTSCGHLDWRRCTRYRIQTCFTPQQKYAVRYKQVEQCCPGWRDDGTGSCIIPVCTQLCLNGATCIDGGGSPMCSCLEGYSGNRCQHEQNHWRAWYTVVLLSLALVAVTVVAAVIYRCQRRRRIKSRVQPCVAVNTIAESIETGSGEPNANIGQRCPTREHFTRIIPSAPPKNS